MNASHLPSIGNAALLDAPFTALLSSRRMMPAAVIALLRLGDADARRGLLRGERFPERLTPVGVPCGRRGHVD